MKPSLSVVGLGKLGLPIACAFAAKGVSVIGVDSDVMVVARLAKPGQTRMEPGVTDEAIKQVSIFTTAYDIAIPNTDATLVIVPTPSDTAGAFSNHYVLDACVQIGRQIATKKTHHTVVIVSTVMPGSIDGPIRQTLENESGKTCGIGFSLLYNPQFVALGSVMHDFTHPELTLIGRSCFSSIEVLLHLYNQVLCTLPSIAVTTPVNAELAKLALNCFVATKASFSNHLARVVENFPGADVDAITDIIGRDSRIGLEYLRAGVVYGGPCFPRDVRAMATLPRSRFFHNIDRTNDDSMIDLKIAIRDLDGTIGILGLPYKVGSDVTDGALGWNLFSDFRQNRSVSADLRCDPASVVAGVDIVVVALDDPRYKDIPDEVWGRPGEKPRIVFDCWRSLGRLAQVNGVDYRPIGIGRSK